MAGVTEEPRNRPGEAREAPDGTPSRRGRASAPEPPPVARRSRRGLDWLVFFVADVQTGFGPFVAVFLSTQKWTQVDIGLVLTIGGLVSLGGQIPLGALVDRLRSLRAAVVVSLLFIAGAALAFALWPVFPVVVVSRVAHAVASSVLGLALVALSVRIAREGHIGERLGRNAAFASAGTGIAAAVMGAAGYYLSSHAVFFLTALMVLPALFALLRIRAQDIAVPSEAPAPRAPRGDLAGGALAIVRNRPLVIFAACVMLFHLANAAMLPLAASLLTMRFSETATVMVAAAMVVPQFTVTVLSPWVGRLAQSWGRRPLLLAGFGALVVRGLLFATVTAPELLVVIQILDGLSAAVLGVLVPLVVFDVAHEGGHFNLAQGTVGCAMGIGASISTVLAGFAADHFGSYAAFELLAAIAGIGFLTVLLVMPETRPRR
ncbi:MFS transporter [Xanthobacter dioxanivorans]|uniref:MFS transporter n=1 Tax=Xanthobacter dioxanivorans TaxID=2528964 RepID=A0A974SHQ8_9HYPH|nr:MFS transporter [Xanthobacter dioxanivorans]